MGLILAPTVFKIPKNTSTHGAAALDMESTERHLQCYSS